MFESVNGRTHGRTPAGVPYYTYKLTEGELKIDAQLN